MRPAGGILTCAVVSGLVGMGIFSGTVSYASSTTTKTETIENQGPAGPPGPQ